LGGIYTAAVLGLKLPLPLVILLAGVGSFCLALLVGGLTLRRRASTCDLYDWPRGLIKNLCSGTRVTFTGTRGALSCRSTQYCLPCHAHDSCPAVAHRLPDPALPIRNLALAEHPVRTSKPQPMWASTVNPLKMIVLRSALSLWAPPAPSLRPAGATSPYIAFNHCSRLWRS